MGPRLPDDGHLQLVDAELAQSREVRGEREGASREIRGSGRIRLEVIELRGEGGSRSGLFRKQRSRGKFGNPGVALRSPNEKGQTQSMQSTTLQQRFY